MPAGAFAEGKRRGEGSDGGLADDPLFCQRATLAAGHHPIAGLDALDVGCDLDHYSGGFQPGYKGGIGTKLIFALGHQQVGKVQSRRMDLYPDFSGFQRRDLLFRDLDR